MPMQSSLPLPPIEASTFEICAEIPCANSPIYRQDSVASIWVIKVYNFNLVTCSRRSGSWTWWGTELSLLANQDCCSKWITGILYLSESKIDGDKILLFIITGLCRICRTWRLFDNQDCCSQSGIRYVAFSHITSVMMPTSLTSHKWSTCICNYPKERIRDKTWVLNMGSCRICRKWKLLSNQDCCSQMNHM